MQFQGVFSVLPTPFHDDGSLDLEASASPELRAGLIALGHKMESVPDSYMDFGAGQFIVKADDGYVAASDSRRDGHAVGF